jgi:lipopolysaccharide/colanic/teichoic acid biosynthesis glycosyltransferase
MAMRSVNAEALPALEPLELERRQEVALRRRGLGSWARGAVVLDVVLLAAAAAMSQLAATRVGIVGVPSAWLVVYGGLAVFFLHVRGMYSWQLRLSMLESARKVIAATALAAMTLVSLRILLPGNVDNLAPQTLRLLAFSAVYLTAGRIALDWAQLKARRLREDARPTLVVGAGRIGSLTARRLLELPELGLEPVGFVDKEPLDEAALPLPVLGASWDLERLIEQHGIEHVVVTFSTAPNDVLLRQIKRCEELGVSVSLVPRLYIVDRLVAGALFLVALPLFALLALGTLLSVGRPVFFRQPRVGRDGNEFEMLKFRSMRASAEPVVVPDLPHDTAPGGIEGDDRRTRFGTFLRRTSLDELPQLLTVLKGDMSLIGPRPERPDFVRLFEDNVYRYGDRHRVKSGITGWAQVHGLRGKTSLTDRVEWDNYYIENWSLWLDVKILLMTVWAVLTYFAQAE